MAFLRQPLLSFVILLSLAIQETHSFHSPTSHTTKQSKPNTKTTTPNPRKGARPLSMTTTRHPLPNETDREIYGIPNSGWKSPQWNWGSARGTGHDCAAICRSRWALPSDRAGLVRALLDPAAFRSARPAAETPFEEVKLILGLSWQGGGGGGGYSRVLEAMAGARRYEMEDEVLSALNFIEDVSGRFDEVCESEEELGRMRAVANDVRGKHDIRRGGDVFMDRRMCAGMVLDAMDWVENGL